MDFIKAGSTYVAVQHIVSLHAAKKSGKDYYVLKIDPLREPKFNTIWLTAESCEELLRAMDTMTIARAEKAKYEVPPATGAADEWGDPK